MQVLLAYYGGPDQIMTVTSGFAGVVGLLLIFWNKVVAAFFRVVRIFRPTASDPVPAKDENETLKETS
ncbi:MAG TPA: hypothetical protein VLV49_15665 [Terriglobales bacterium]|nr:hypothetical protein [Terriglobales bacterium]